MTQPQLSVRERARKMFDDNFREMFFEKIAGAITYGEIINFIDQIITLAQEDVVEKYGSYNDGCGCCMNEDLCKALTGESNYDREKRLEALK